MILADVKEEEDDDDNDDNDDDDDDDDGVAFFVSIVGNDDVFLASKDGFGRCWEGRF